MRCDGGVEVSSSVSPLLGEAGPSVIEVSVTGRTLFQKAFVST
jgi:hypothetical protein